MHTSLANYNRVLTFVGSSCSDTCLRKNLDENYAPINVKPHPQVWEMSGFRWGLNFELGILPEGRGI